MAGEGKTIARTEGVSTLKSGAAPDGEQGERVPAQRGPQISRQTRQERTEERLAASGAGRGADEIERAAEETAANATEHEQLEAREEKLEGKIDEAKLKGDAKAVRTLQSQLESTRGDLKRVESERDQWPAWIVAQAQAGKTPAQMIEEIRKVQTANAARRAITQRSEPDEIIAGLIDSDDPDDLEFARFLRKRVKAEIPVNARNLAHHREEFEELRGARSTNGTTTTAKTTTRKTPPKVAGAGGGGLGGEETGWRPGVSTTDLLSRGFAEQDRARRH